MLTRLSFLAAVALALLGVVSVAAYATTGGASSPGSGPRMQVAGATATGTVEPSQTAEATETPEATEVPEATETPGADDTNDEDNDHGAHQGDVLGIPREDSPACENHQGCVTVTTPGGATVRVPSHGADGHGRGHENGEGAGKGKRGSGDDGGGSPDD